LEFKKTAYQLGDAADKSEFAKDVAGMANAGGGLIVLGIETQRDPMMGRDKSVKMRPLAPGTVILTQMEEVARTWIYPPQRGLDIKEWPDAKGRDARFSSGPWVLGLRRARGDSRPRRSPRSPHNRHSRAIRVSC
jgi:hypothetical protein